MEVNIKIKRKDVFNEVGKATDYTGAKLIDADSKARDRIYAEEEDLLTLKRFWNEGLQTINERLKGMVSHWNEGEVYNLFLDVSVAFDQVLLPSVEKELRSFLISFIIGKWFNFANKDEAAAYFLTAEENLTNAERLLYSRRKPKAPA